MKHNETEIDIQRRVYWVIGTRREYCIANIYVYGRNESDLLTVTKAGYVDEIEVKVTRSDFHKDKSKHRHEAYLTLPAWRYTEQGPVCWLHGLAHYPNRFWYAVPENLVTPEEVPEYAGLYYVTDDGRVYAVKKAPQLHEAKAGPFVVRKILRAAYFRHIETWRYQAE